MLGCQDLSVVKSCSSVGTPRLMCSTALSWRPKDYLLCFGIHKFGFNHHQARINTHARDTNTPNLEMD